MATTNIQIFPGQVQVTSNLTVDTSTLHVDSVTNSVGLGTTLPLSNLHVVGNVYATSNITTASNVIVGDTTASSSKTSGALTVAGGVGVGGALYATGLYTDDYVGHIGDTNTYLRFPAVDTFTVTTSGTERVRVDPVGRVGIQTNVPTSNLHVVGNVYATSNISTSSNVIVGASTISTSKTSGALQVAGGVGVGANVYAAALFTDDFVGHIGDTNTYLRFPADDTFTVTTSGTERVRVNSSGDVGIGTASPAFKLDVHGTANVGALTATSIAGQITALNLSGGTVDATTGTFSGDVGIGTTSPAYKLDVHGTSNVGALTATSVYQAGAPVSVRWEYSNSTAFPQNPASAKYYKLASLGTTSATDNAGKIRISGTLGGFTTSTTSLIDCYVLSRGGLIYGGSLTGAGSAFDTTQCDILVYKQANNTYDVYLKTFQYFTFDLIISGATLNAYLRKTVYRCPTTDTSVSTPVGTLEGSIVDACTFVTTDTGNVGIGTTSPAYKLDVHGTSNVGALTATSATVPSDGDFVMGGKPLQPTSGLHWDRVNSRLGVGTNAPAYKLDVHGTSNVGALTATSVSGVGSGLTNLDAGNISSGTVNNNRLNTATTSTAGIVQLSDSTSTTSSTVAATSTAVKAAYDRNSWGTGTFSGAVSTGALTASSATVPSDGDFVMGGKPIKPATSLYWDRTNSRLGVGTNSPNASLHVQGARSIFGDNGGASDIVINDIPNARWQIATGGYALRFNKHNSSSDEYSTWSEKVRIDQNGNVGIGTSSPSEQLHLTGNLRVDGANQKYYLEYRYQTIWTSNNNQTFTIPVTGSSARGIMLVEAKVIQVAANSSGERVARVKGLITNYDTGNFYMTVIEGENVDAFETYIVGTSGSATGTFTMKYRPAEGYLQSVVCRLYLKIWIGGYTSSLGSLTRTDAGSNAALTAPTFNSAKTIIGGDVGIGTSNPQDNLHIYSNESGGTQLKIENANTTGDTRAGLFLQTRSSNVFSLQFTPATEATIFDNKGQGGYAFYQQNGSATTNHVMQIDKDGKVGIGTASPSTTLHVKTPTGTTSNYLKIASYMDDGSTRSISGIVFDTNPQFSNGDNGIRSVASIKSGFYDGSWRGFMTLGTTITGGTIVDTLTCKNGRVGIGTTSPGCKLHVNGGICLEAEDMGQFGVDSISDAANRTKTYIKFAHAGTDNDWAYLRQIGGSNGNHIALDFHDDGNDAGFSIRDVQSTATPDTVTTRFMVQRGGNVGIGTTSPAALLHVNGNIYASGSISQACYGFFDLSKLSYPVGPSPLEWTATNVSGMTLASNNQEITMSASGIYRICLKLNSDSSNLSTRKRLGFILQYYDGTTWVTFQQSEEEQYWSGASEFVTEYMIDTSTYTIWRILFDPPPNQGWGFAGQQWSRLMIAKIA